MTVIQDWAKRTSEDRQSALGREVPFPGRIQDVNLVGFPADAK